MAKKTKDSDLPIEERLEQALIPNWDEPYKLPDNWCWLKLLSAFENCTDSKKKIQQKDYLESGLWSVVDQGQSLVGGYTNDETMLYNGNLPVIIFGDHTRCVKYIDFNFAQGADGVKVLRPKPFYLPKFFFYALQNVDIPNLGYRRHFPLFDKFSIPLAPLEEQQRIVEHVESLFAKLDEAKEKAQEVVDGFETRKAAILHKAFSGELTAKWRSKNEISIQTWNIQKLKNCGTWCGGGTPSMQHPEYWENGNLLWITAKDMKSDIITETQMLTNMLGVENSSANYIEKPSILFVMRSGILRRTLPIAMVKIPFTVNQDLKVLTPDKLNLEYLFWACKAFERDILKKCMKSGTTVESINSHALLEYELPIPQKREQEEIVSIIKALIAKEVSAIASAEAIIDQIDTMKKAILARAFRGELGTNDPSEESAVELLKSVLMGNTNQQEPQKSSKKSISIPNHIETALLTKLEKKIVSLFYTTERKVVSVDEIMSVSSKKIDIIDTLTKLEQRGILIRLNNSCYRIKE